MKKPNKKFFLLLLFLFWMVCTCIIAVILIMSKRKHNSQNKTAQHQQNKSHEQHIQKFMQSTPPQNIQLPEKESTNHTQTEITQNIDSSSSHIIEQSKDNSEEQNVEIKDKHQEYKDMYEKKSNEPEDQAQQTEYPYNDTVKDTNTPTTPPSWSDFIKPIETKDSPPKQTVDYMSHFIQQQSTNKFHYQNQTLHIPDIESEEYLPEVHHETASLTFGIHPNNILSIASNLSLLNESLDFDKSVILQTIVDMPIDIKKPAQDWGKVEYNFTGRINTLWGSSELAQTTSDFVKIGRSITETKHYHEFDRPIFWVKETWLKLYSLSEQVSFQIGLFPKQIGLGLILGDHYKAGNPLLTGTHEKFIDQYRPGFEFTARFGENHDYSINLYYSLYKNNSTSFDKQIEFTQSQELCNCGDGPPFLKQTPSRSLFQASHLASLQADIPITINRTIEDKLHLQPFVMYNHDRNQTVEFVGDAESHLLTIGSSINFKHKGFEFDFDIAGNLGYQDVKSWDRNVTEQHARMTLTHLFAKSFKNVSTNSNQSNSQLIANSGEFILSPTFPYPPSEDISLCYEAGEEFQGQDPSLITTTTGSSTSCCPTSSSGSTQTTNCNPIFKNSYSRFRKCYRNDFRAFMAAVDMAYTFCENTKIGCIFGYASGDDNPNDSAEKAYLYRLRSDWDQVRQDTDCTYQGFQGIHSLYTGKHVRSVQLLRSHRLSRPINQSPELTANQFSNMVYGGFGLWYEKEYQRGTLRCNINALAMALAHPVTFGFDPVIQDIYQTFDFKANSTTEQRFKAYNKTLGQYLGTEISAFIEFFGKNDISLYSIFSIFFAGDYYDDIRSLSNNNIGQVIPLKNQFKALAQEKSGFENIERNQITLRNNTAIVVQAGLKYNFDTTELYNKIRPKRRKNKVK